MDDLNDKRGQQGSRVTRLRAGEEGRGGPQDLEAQGDPGELRGNL